MKTTLSILLLIALVASLAPGNALAQEGADRQATLAAIARYEFGEDRAPLARLDAEIRGAAPEALLEIERGLLGLLESNRTTYAGRQFACRKLRMMGSEACVPKLAEMLRNAQLADDARFALAGLPFEAVDAALRAALEELPEDRLAGVISTLGRRGDRLAVSALALRVTSRYPRLGRAALSALGQIGSAEVVLALQHIEIPHGLRALHDEVLLSCADRLADEGQDLLALAILRPFTQRQEGIARIAAWRGIVRIEGETAIPTLSKLLFSRRRDLSTAAAGLIAELPPQTDLKPLYEVMGNNSGLVQPIMLEALAARRDPAAAPIVFKFARYSGSDSARAALRALAHVGGATHVEFLAHRAAEGGEDARAAEWSLERIGGEGIEEAFLSSMEKLAGPVRSALIRCAVRRRLHGLLPALLAHSRDADPAVRREALGGLNRLAGVGEIPALIELLATAENEEDRKATRNALRSVCKRLDDHEKACAPLIAAIADCTGTTRNTLLQLLGEFPCESGLQSLYTALDGIDVELRDASVRALGKWSDTRPMERLLAIARESGDQSSTALRGYIRLAGIMEDNAREARRDAFAGALPLTHTKEEKQLLIQTTSKISELWVRAYLEPFLDDAEVGAAAKLALWDQGSRLARTVSSESRGCAVTLATPHHKDYAAGGAKGLTDGKWGSENHRDGKWQGYEGEDLDATLDLGSAIELQSVRVAFLENHHSWIFLPLTVEFYASLDGKRFESIGKMEWASPGEQRKKAIHDCLLELGGERARYLRIHARSVGVCPPWHGGGGKAFLFVDEIQVNPRFGE